MNWLLDFWNELIKEITPSDTGYYTTIISIAFGAVTLFISLSIIPFQKLSESVSGYLYKILIKDRKTIITLGISLFISFSELFFSIILNDCLLTRIIYFLGLIIIFIVLCMYSINLLKMLDITTSIFPALEKDLTLSIKKVEKIKKDADKNLVYKYNDFQNQIKNAILCQESPEIYSKGSVFYGCSKVFSYKFSFLYELILKNIDNHDYATYEACVDGLEKCLNVYFNYIDNHYIVFDNFFLDFVEHSKIIITESCKMDSSLYFEYYCILFEKIIDKLNNINIPKEFYQDQIICFFFDFVFLERKSITDCTRYIQKSFDFIIDGKTNRIVFEKYCKYFESLISILYKNTQSVEKSHLNYLINVFTYKVLSCKSNLYDKQVISAIIDLQEKEDANNLLPPTLVFDDYTTNIAVGFGKNDYTLSSCVVNFILPQEELQDDAENQYRNIYRINILKQIISILEIRYRKGGTYISGIDEQLFVIYFKIIVLLNEELFKYYSKQNWTYSFSEEEKKEYLECLIQIIKITAKGKNQFSKGCNILFSELKLLTFLLLDDDLCKMKLEDFIWKYKRELYIYILDNDLVDKKMIREIYKFLFSISSKNIKKHILKKIHVKKNNAQNYPNLFLFDDDFDISQLWLQGISKVSNVDRNVQKIVNNKIYDYLKNNSAGVAGGA